MRRESTRRIGVTWVTGEQRRLAAATSEVLLALIATTARLRHPRRPTKTIEGRRFRPNPRQRVVPHILKVHAGNLPGRWTGKHVPHGIHRQIAPSPAIHAGLRTVTK